MKPVTYTRLCPRCGHTIPVTLVNDRGRYTWNGSCRACAVAESWSVTPGERKHFGLDRVGKHYPSRKR